MWPRLFSLPDGGLLTFPPGEVQRGEVWSRGCWAFELTGPSLSSSQSDIGFGKLETYVKLDKLGEVRGWVWSSWGSQQESQGLPPPSLTCPLTAPAHRGTRSWLGSWAQPLAGGGAVQVLEEGVRKGWPMGCRQHRRLFFVPVFLVRVRIRTGPCTSSATPRCLGFLLCQTGALTGLPHRAVEGRSGHEDKPVGSTQVPGVQLSTVRCFCDRCTRLCVRGCGRAKGYREEEGGPFPAETQRDLRKHQQQEGQTGVTIEGHRPAGGWGLGADSSLRAGGVGMLCREMKGKGGRALQLESQPQQGHKRGALERGQQHLRVAGATGFFFAGHLCHRLQRAQQADREPRGLEGDPAGARGGSALHRHPRGYSTPGS